MKPMQIEGRDTSGRRKFLTMLGLGAGFGVCTETLGRDLGGDTMKVPLLAQASPGGQEKIAKALENLATEIRAGNVNAIQLKTGSELKLMDGHWLEHTVTVVVEMLA